MHHYGVSERYRCADILQRFDPGSRAVNRDRTVVKNAPEDRLVDIDALDFVHVDFDRTALDQTALQDDTAIRDRDFGAEAP